MKNIVEESSRIASLAVFRELYDSEKDVYGIISCFLKEIIIVKAKHNFALYEITCLLNETFNFHIPEAVVRTSLNRLNFLKKERGIYSANLSGIQSQDLIPKKSKIAENNGLIVKQVVEFIATQKKKTITEDEIEEITHSFCSFLLDKSNNQKYSEYISAFIIANQHKADFINQLKCIKEGVVLYAGIMFNEDINNIGSWDTELTIFLDTEILFDFTGLNGEIYESLFGEFFSFVKEINRKATKPLIKLRYFANVEESIRYYFKKAEDILIGNGIVNPGRPAMNNILNGCKSRSDVIEKKAVFFDSLFTNNILIDNYPDYYEKENHKYNIADEHTIELISNSLDIKDIDDNLNPLNFISIRRKESCDNNFEHIKYILLSASFNTLQLAWHNEIRPSGKVPLATSLSFLTDKFWFKLNKGFGTNTFPRVFDVITKAQILLSGQLNNSVVDKFEELQSKSKDGQLTEREVTTILAELRREAKKPEDINSDNLSFVLNSISEDSIEKIIQEQEYFKHSAKQQETENIKLNKEIEKKQILCNKMSKENEIVLGRENEKAVTINKIKAEIKRKCHKKCRERINLSLWILWGLFLSIIISQWHHFKFYLSLYVLFALVLIITAIFIELRFRINILSTLPPKLTDFLSPKLKNRLPKKMNDFEKQLIEKCIMKESENIGIK